MGMPRRGTQAIPQRQLSHVLMPCSEASHVTSAITACMLWGAPGRPHLHVDSRLMTQGSPSWDLPATAPPKRAGQRLCCGAPDARRASQTKPPCCLPSELSRWLEASDESGCSMAKALPLPCTRPPFFCPLPCRPLAQGETSSPDCAAQPRTASWTSTGCQQHRCCCSAPPRTQSDEASTPCCPRSGSAALHGELAWDRHQAQGSASQLQRCWSPAR